MGVAKKQEVRLALVNAGLGGCDQFILRLKKKLVKYAVPADVFSEALLVDDPARAAAMDEGAKAWAADRTGLDLEKPIEPAQELFFWNDLIVDDDKVVSVQLLPADQAKALIDDPDCSVEILPYTWLDALMHQKPAIHSEVVDRIEGSDLVLVYKEKCDPAV